MSRIYDHPFDVPLNPAVKADLSLNFCDVVSRTDHTIYQQRIQDNLKGYDLPDLKLESFRPSILEGWTIPIGAHSDDKKKGVPLTPIEKPNSKLPDAWNHPESTKMDGKCGITGVSNLLRFYGVEKAPGDIDTWSRRSWGPGMRVDKFTENVGELSGATFHSRNIEEGDALDVLRGHIKDNKPVAIMYMTGPSNAHWVVVTNVTDTKDGPKLTVQSWGGYHEVPWKDIQDNWRRGYGGPYPHCVGDKASEVLKKAK
jgi:hypothetical protein